jgi:2-polyprenyl-3-methyl-5-hydroxy-6-metoxy-1,4-benzoquinol methylase
MNEKNINPIENASTRKAAPAPEQYSKEMSKEYANVVEIDPVKQYSQFPEELKLLGKLKGKKLLDIGCGSGGFTRMMAERGAEIFGYDPSLEQVEKAQEEEERHPLGIKYIVSDRPSISPDIKFDLASSVMVLVHAEDKQKLQEIFQYANDSLKTTGRFVSIVLNPNFKRLGEAVYNRRFTREGNKNFADFLDSKGTSLLPEPLTSIHHSKDEYEEAAKNAGFKRVEWKTLSVDPRGKEKLGVEFWDKYEEDCPWIGLVAYKDE